MNTDSQAITAPLERRCDMRLLNDVKALEAAASPRLRVDVARFGSRITAIRLTFPRVVTAFSAGAMGEVEIRPAVVVANIGPDAGSSLPYPLGAPEVRIHFPGLTRESRATPWLGGLFWFQGPESINGSLPSPLRMLMAVLCAVSEPPVGMPCLWRQGEWNMERDLIFVARQIHRLLTDPGDYSPTDSMNPEAAIYWAGHKDMLPLEPPIPELYGRSTGVSARRGSQFRLNEVREQ